MRKTRLWLLVGAATFLALVALVLSYSIVRTRLCAGGSHALAALKSPVTIDEDDHGVPTIRGQSLHDVIRAEGWILARDRLFQMDLVRRRSAGRLAEILGSAAIESDRLRRRYGFAILADRVVDKIHPDSRAVLEAFAEGVSAFIEKGPLPLEMRLLGYQPDKWRAADSVLVALSMYDPPDSERALTLASELLPQPALSFFVPRFGLFDAPILPDPSTPPLPIIPAPNVFSLRDKSIAPRSDAPRAKPSSTDGSNGWAIAGRLTTSGKPILAGDPHLSLSLPNIWYRMKLEGPDFSVTGVTIPGVPGILIGTNGHIAWTFTNGMADHADRVPLKPGQPVVTRTESIAVKGKPAVEENVRVTPWGPVITEDGKDYALQWVALDLENYQRIEMTRLNLARDLDSAFTALADWSGPVFNAVLAPADGHIGWTVVGHIPNRIGFDGGTTVPRDGSHRWDHFIPYSQYPKVVDPPQGFIVSANQRSIPFTKDFRRFSSEGISPARAYRLKTEIAQRKDWDVLSSYGLQLDVTSVIHRWYRDELVKSVGKDQDPWLVAIATLVSSWDGRFATDCAPCGFLRDYREALFSLFLESTLSKIASKDDREAVRDRLSNDEWMAALLRDRPLHLLSSRYSDYDTALRETASTVARRLVDKPAKLATLRWGDVNRTAIRHPFSAILPSYLGFLVNAPESPLPGTSHVPREGLPSHGASMRMVVDLGDRGKSLFNHAGGQSGHLLASHYVDQYPAWLAGTPQPFEPGVARATTTLTVGASVR